LHDQNPLKVIPFQVVTFGLISACVGVFLYQQFLPGERERALLVSFGTLPAVLFEHRALAPDLVVLPAELTLLSSIFLHGGWLHLVGNMAFLWVFGDNVEDSMGHWRFLVFFCVCGVFASFTHALAQPDSVTPLIGASGAVAGVLGAYLMLHPRVRIILLAFLKLPLLLPAYLMIIAWVGLQVYSIIFASDETTAWWAHIGGFVAGVILIPFFKRAEVPLFDRGTPH
ncbi:MAG: rhomboid family intramembrane serine protease, partial [Gammaproteobacteria bacterium]